MVAPSYSRQRSAFAKKIGFGKPMAPAAKAGAMSPAAKAASTSAAVPTVVQKAEAKQRTTMDAAAKTPKRKTAGKPD
jgi:hypothetical protein